MTRKPESERRPNVAKQRSGTVIIERGGGSSLWWFLVGGALGAGLALLFAPQSGDRTRRMVGRKLGKLRDAADAALEDLQDALSPIERVDRSLAEENQGDEGSEASESASGEERGTEDPKDSSEIGPPPRRAVSARQELEQRLANARARRQRALVDEDEEPVA